jgi:hypothetical protein
LKIFLVVEIVKEIRKLGKLAKLAHLVIVATALFVDIVLVTEM